MTRMPKINCPKGFSLVELMVGLALSLFLIGGLLLTLQTTQSANADSTRLARIQENVRFLSDYLVREMRNAGFRDQVSLTFDQFNTFSGTCVGAECGFARITDGGARLTIRMSGTSSCAEPFVPESTARIVTNEYFLDQASGTLRCLGSTASGPQSVDLATGLQSLRFEFICPASNPDCGDPFCALFGFQGGINFDVEEANLAATCQGVAVSLGFVGLQPDAPVDVLLTAGFRNVALGRLKFAAIP